ncbi:MAG: GNAT family N-acetyltransferase [Chloroflexi bacterium]|nr:MAG: GNAT family N-acetyltransferase [Chloroflexota bacterium]
MKVPELLTPRLRLRGWREGDVERMAEIYTDPEVMRYLRPLDLEGTRQQLLRFERQWEELGFGIWAVEERASDRLIGRIGLMWHDDWTATPHDAEVGWTLERSSWGQGVATEGGAASLGFGFEQRGLERIISIAHRENRASQRVMEKLGLRPEGETAWRGQPVTWYAIARSEWQASAS